MRTLMIGATMLALAAAAPAIAKPTATQIDWNLRGALTPQIDIRVTPPEPRQPEPHQQLLLVQAKPDATGGRALSADAGGRSVGGG